MTNYFIRIFLIAALSSLAIAQIAKDPKCIEQAEKSEAGIRRLILVNDDSKLPKTEDDFMSYCNLSKQMYKTLSQYKTCLTPLGQEALGMALKSIAKVLKKHCGDKAGRETSLELLRCAPDNTIVKTRECATQTLNILEYLATPAVTAKDVIPMICCMSHMTNACVRDKIRSNCPNVNVAEYFDKLVSSVSKEIIDFACEGYNSLQHCEKRSPKQMEKLRQVASTTAPEITKRKFVAPILKIGLKIVE